MKKMMKTEQVPIAKILRHIITTDKFFNTVKLPIVPLVKQNCSLSQ